jgi:hypothetical protein
MRHRYLMKIAHHVPDPVEIGDRGALALVDLQEPALIVRGIE